MAFAENYSATLARHYVAAASGSDPGGVPVASFMRRNSAAQAGTSGAAMPLGSATQSARRAPADLRLPCMVYAAVGVFANAGTQDVELSMAEARKAPGVLNVLSYPGAAYDGSLACKGGVAVIARGYWLARRALARWMDQCGTAPLDGGEDRPDQSGGVLTAAGAAVCTAQFYNGQLHLWMATSDPARVRAAAARIAGCALDAVDLRVLGHDDSPHGLAVLVPSIALARELQSAPVQLIVAHDLGLYCQASTVFEAPRALREVPGPDLVSALAA